MKKVMLLGGSISQLIAITTAKEMGYYTILCDYLPNNPGRLVADEWYQISTVDYDKVLEVAIKTKIDGILTYGSDIAASTAAYVAEKLDLPTSPYKSVYLLTHKNEFRKFLKDNGFNVPYFESFSIDEKLKAIDFIKNSNIKVIVKPVDSQGARGISKIIDYSESEIKEAIDLAYNNSRSKRIIIEEYLEKSDTYIGGDGFTINGKIVFAPLSNIYFPKSENVEFVPTIFCWPHDFSNDLLKNVLSELQRLMDLLKMQTHAYDFEVLVDKLGKLYIIEVGPRTGGPLIPRVTEKMTGYSLIRASLQAAVGDVIDTFGDYKIDGYWAIRALYSYTGGILKDIIFDNAFKENNLQVFEQYVEIGNKVSPMNSLSTIFACAGAKFETKDKMDDFIKFPEKYIDVKIC